MRKDKSGYPGKQAFTEGGKEQSVSAASGLWQDGGNLDFRLRGDFLN